MLDSVWAAEFAAAGFLYALEDLDEHWVREEHEVDFLDALVAANRYEGRTFGVSAFADVAGFWYRRRELEAIGAEPPATWAELRAVARALVRERPPAPDRHARRLAGRRDDRVLPDLVPRLERREVLERDGVSLDSP